MKKYIIYMFVVALLTTSINVFSQTTTVTFKPNATVGKDAVIKADFSVNDPYAPTNYGNSPELSMTSIPYKTSSTVTASLLRFDQLSTIPNNAIILSATLKLYGVPSSTNFPLGNNTSGGNTLLIERIIDQWDENTVAWITQPNTTYTDAISVPSATSQWNWNYTINSTPTSAPQLINMLNAMKGNSNNNWGFMIMSQSINTTYLATLFASSDHSNSALWPELTVTYEVIDCDFTTCVSTIDQDLYTFSALNTYGNHEWYIYDGNYNQIYYSNSSSFNYTFPADHYFVEHYVNTNNQSCYSAIEFCVDQSQQAAAKSKKEEISDATNTTINIIKANTIKVYPNPSSDNWNVILTSEKAENVDVIVTDCTGKIVSNDKNNLIKGDNSFVIDGSKLPKGTYVLEIKGETNQFTQKLLKN